MSIRIFISCVAAGLIAVLAADQWTEALGVSLAAALALALAAGGSVLALVYSHYYGVLGARDEIGSREWTSYETLRGNLAGGGAAVHLYARWLTAFLDRVDRFFGDAGLADRTLFPRAFGLRTPAPLWTAPAFDRCLLLALLYPITIIVITWAVSGRVGPAEEALGLQRDHSSWDRGLAVVTGIALYPFAAWLATRSSGWIRIGWFVFPIVLVFASSLSLFGNPLYSPADGNVSFTIAGVLSFAAVNVLTFAFAGTRTGVGAAAFAIAHLLFIDLIIANPGNPLIFVGILSPVVACYILGGPAGRPAVLPSAFLASLMAAPMPAYGLALAERFIAGTIDAKFAVSAIGGTISYFVILFVTAAAGAVAAVRRALILPLMSIAGFIFISVLAYNVTFAGITPPDVDVLSIVFSGFPMAFFIFAIVFGAATAVITTRLVGDSVSGGWRRAARSFFIFLALLAGCLVAARFGTNQVSITPSLLFLGLLTLLNAPFDWVSLGLTRALLRRGLELKGWWPFVLAVADALAAAVIVALLALTMVVGVQTFDALVVHGGSNAVLPLAALFDGITAHPEGPEYWWIYALLLSTMIPSLVNLAIGGTALMRAAPGLPQRLLRFLPVTGGVSACDRAWIAAVLTVQAALGTVIGLAVQAFVAWGLFSYVMPAAGLGLLHLARGLAALDLPAHVIALFPGGPGP